MKDAMRIWWPHLSQIGLYLLSGGMTALLDFGSYFLLLWMGTWYVTANIVSNTLGFFGAFLLHKYVVFQKNGLLFHHFCRYCVLNGMNFVVQFFLLILLVETFGMDEGTAKLASWLLSSIGNFFLYKFLVYV
ncbi:GtrA family protein [Candidatus Peregrinibacteria bacterium]|nr:GtrA family protein [Candidatus Peregrinibacteria bacterium]MBI2524265.1 GtrA family protein [Candidatus Peregrinibacteria bacterium]MBI4129244.1 GtrA family protein [Candidatus Peregrinibacteria bacterium]